MGNSSRMLQKELPMVFNMRHAGFKQYRQRSSTRTVFMWLLVVLDFFGNLVTLSLYSWRLTSANPWLPDWLTDWQILQELTPRKQGAVLMEFNSVNLFCCTAKVRSVNSCCNSAGYFGYFWSKSLLGGRIFGPMFIVLISVTTANCCEKI